MDATARRAAFEACEPKIWWERNLFSTLVIVDPSIAIDILRSTDFALPDLRALVREMRRRQPNSFIHLQPALELLPIFLENQDHTRIRKILGQYLSSKHHEIEQRLPNVICGLLDSIPQSGEINLVTQLLTPLIGDVFSKLVDRDLSEEVMGLRLGKMFEVKHTMASLSKLDVMLERVCQFLGTDPSSDEDEFICQLNCLVFGVENVISTLAENLFLAFQLSGGTAPAQLPPYPVEVMISTTHRSAISPTEIAGHRVKPSDIIRIHLEPFGYSNDRAINSALFGAGRHACIGKQLTLTIWKHLTEQFNSRKFAGVVTEFESDRSHSFHVTKTLKIVCPDKADRVITT
jgi:hypothetical protein